MALAIAAKVAHAAAALLASRCSSPSPSPLPRLFPIAINVAFVIVALIVAAALLVIVVVVAVVIVIAATAQIAAARNGSSTLTTADESHESAAWTQADTDGVPMSQLVEGQGEEQEPSEHGKSKSKTCAAGAVHVARKPQRYAKLDEL